MDKPANEKKKLTSVGICQCSFYLFTSPHISKMKILRNPSYRAQTKRSLAKRRHFSLGFAAHRSTSAPQNWASSQTTFLAITWIANAWQRDEECLHAWETIKQKQDCLVFTYLLWLSLYHNLIYVIFLADFYKVHDFAIDNRFGVQFDNITNFVDLYSWAGRDAQHAVKYITWSWLLRGWQWSVEAHLQRTTENFFKSASLVDSPKEALINSGR